MRVKILPESFVVAAKMMQQGKRLPLPILPTVAAND